MIGEYSIIGDNVELGKNCSVEPFCNLGISPSNNFLKLLIGDNAKIRAGTYIYEGNQIGNNFQTGNKANIRELNKIGNNVSIGTHTVIEHRVEIQDNVRIHTNVFIPEYSILKEGAWIGPNVVFTNSKYPQSKSSKTNLFGPTIEKNVIVGAGSVLLPGITIGEHAIIGSGSVVNKDVDPYTVVVGNPVRRISHVSELTGNPYEL